MTSKEKATVIFAGLYEEWATSQEGQKNAFEYEKSFDGFIRKVGQDVLQESVGKEDDRKKKDWSRPGTVK